MAKETHPPSISETAFDCPHCGTYTTQYWFESYANIVECDPPTPVVVDAEYEEFLREGLAKGET